MNPGHSVCVQREVRDVVMRTAARALLLRPGTPSLQWKRDRSSPRLHFYEYCLSVVRDYVTFQRQEFFQKNYK